MEIRSNFISGTGNAGFPSSKPSVNPETAKPTGNAGGDLFSKISTDNLKNQMSQLRDLKNNIKVGGGCGSAPAPKPKPKPKPSGGC